MPRAVKVGALAAAVVVAGGVVAWWWPSDGAAAPALVEGGFSSGDMDAVRISTPLSTETIFRCTPGTLGLWVGVVADQGEFELVDVSVPLLDDVWVDLGWSERSGIQVMRDPNGAGDLDDLEDFTGRHLSVEEGWARMELTWEIHECTQMDAILGIEQVEVTYRADGRERRALVPLVEPLRMTTQSLDELTDQVTVERR